MDVDSNPVAVPLILDIAPVSSKEFLDIHGTIECRFTLKRVRDKIRTHSHIELTLFILEENLRLPLSVFLT